MTTIPEGIRPDQSRKTATAGEIRHLHGFLALPISAVRAAGPAAQSLAGLLAIFRMDGKSTFRRQEQIAKAAGLPGRTARRHLAELQEVGIIIADGRHDRRTVTYRLAATEAAVMADGFLPLPKFALDLPWSQRVLYAWLVYRAEISPDQSTVQDSVSQMAKATGIGRRTAGLAIADLAAKGLIDHQPMLAGEPASITLLWPPSEGCAEMAATNLGSAKMAGEGAQKWPDTCAEMAAAVSKEEILEHGPRSVDHKEISIQEIQDTAGQVFRKAGYGGQDGKNLWKMAAGLRLGIIAENELWDACQGAAECKPHSRPAYIYAIVANHLTKRGADLQAELNRIRIVPTWPSGPPARRDVTADLASMSDIGQMSD